ncbi:MAG: nucleoside deaminase [Alphaproteobacteria bacterium]|nr:nucleoside deaminase [Alphaproteobacteria bacterium]
MTDEAVMMMALKEAELAGARGEVPVGAALTDASGDLLARAGNRILELRDPTAHAEILVLREAALRLGNERLVDTTLYVTLEPCAMCAGAISLARVARLVFAAADPKGGAVLHGPTFFAQPTCHHRPQVVRLLDQSEAAGTLLKTFFRARRT